MVECQLPKLDVAGSTPVSRSISFNRFQTLTPSSMVTLDVIGAKTRSLIGSPSREHSIEIRLARKDHSVRLSRALPTMGPLAIGKVEARLPVQIMKGSVHAESARRLVQFHQI